MRQSSIILLILTFFTASILESQGQSRKSFINFDVSAGPGSLTEKMTKELTISSNRTKEKTEKIGYDLNYKTMTYTAALEYQLEGFITRIEARYTKASFDKFKDYTDTDWLILTPAAFENLNMYEGAFYFGGVINRKHRFQVPILGGVGLGYISGEPINHMNLDFLYKVRAKYYITDKIGIFAGITGSYGGTALDDENPGPEAEKWREKNRSKDDLIDVVTKRLYFEAGLTFMLGRKK